MAQKVTAPEGNVKGRLGNEDHAGKIHKSLTDILVTDARVVFDGETRVPSGQQRVGEVWYNKPLAKKRATTLRLQGSHSGASASMGIKKKQS
jgi:hypothetical protein